MSKTLISKSQVLKEWQPYLDARKNRVKQVWQPLLEMCLKRVDDLPDETRFEYIHSLCVLYFEDGHYVIPIRQPRIWKHIYAYIDDDSLWDDPQKLFWLVRAFTNTHENLKDAYAILKKQPQDIMRRVIELQPGHIGAIECLYLDHLNCLDFGMHSIDTGMLIDKETGVTAIKECEQLMVEYPQLKAMKTRFGGDLATYKSLFYAWYEYKDVQSNLNFTAWYNERYDREIENS